MGPGRPGEWRDHRSGREVAGPDRLHPRHDRPRPRLRNGEGRRGDEGLRSPTRLRLPPAPALSDPASRTGPRRDRLVTNRGAAGPPATGYRTPEGKVTPIRRPG